MRAELSFGQFQNKLNEGQLLGQFQNKLNEGQLLGQSQNFLPTPGPVPASRMSGTCPGGCRDGCVAENVGAAEPDVSCASPRLAASSGATASRLEQSASGPAEAHAEAQVPLVPYDLSDSSPIADDERLRHDHRSAEPEGVC